MKHKFKLDRLVYGIRTQKESIATHDEVAVLQQFAHDEEQEHDAYHYR